MLTPLVAACNFRMFVQFVKLHCPALCSGSMSLRALVELPVCKHLEAQRVKLPLALHRVAGMDELALAPQEEVPEVLRIGRLRIGYTNQ